MEMLDTCICTQLRTTARVITRVYDALLRDTGLKASQLAVLAAVDSAHSVSIAELSKRLTMDRTTLTRNLKPLLSAELVHLGDEGWRRSKLVRITKAGQQRLALAMPLWERAQQDVCTRFGEQRWQAVRSHLRDLTSQY
ncbi:MAG TPA: MarR family winged helix-turn-helix transcriptional regulator [Burkholderiaceae bacterium]|nr:MarR family winged helix-turn-helix transcriptional regulator [Burkholderiaceae bacterium]